MSSPDVETKLPFSLLGTLLVQANEGRTLFRGAHSIAILLDGKQTGEKFTTLLVTSPKISAFPVRRSEFLAWSGKFQKTL
jgi:hypothetical protein